MATKIVKAAIALAFLAGLGILGYTFGNKWYNKKYGIENRRNLSENLTVVEYNNGEIGIENNSVDKIVGRYDKVLRTFLPDEAAHCIRIVIKNNLRGYISAQTGEVIFEPQFLYAWVDDPASSLAACVNKDHKLGFVDVKTKQVAIPFQFDFDDDLFFGHYYYHSEKFPILDFVFSNDICIVPGKDGKIGMIDKTGKLLLPAVYTDIINWRDANTPNIILKKQADKDSGYDYVYGVCDRNFKMIVPFEYNSFEKNWEYEDYADWNVKMKNYIVAKDGKYGILDTLFNEILPIKYDNIEVSENSYIVSLNDKYGALDNNFKTILPVEYDWIMATHTNGDFDNSKFIAKKDYVQKLYDEKGKILNDFYVENRSGEYDEDVEKSAFESVFEPNKTTLSAYIKYYLDGNYGIIDGAQRVVIPAKYDNVEYLGNGNFACTEGEHSFLIKDQK
ncbi:MAG: WG repeat-containing protein [Prevotellaceae bacterium]|jgi:hypothetical protein|nr:WG repeat-containing protein [Prevotellaceae bacterium]